MNNWRQNGAGTLRIHSSASHIRKSVQDARSYLNGGALVAIPAAGALFRTEVAPTQSLLIASAGSFVLALVLIVAAYFCAFFTMAKRAEREEIPSHEKSLILGALYYPIQNPDPTAQVESRRTLGIGEEQGF
jgi:hypothetical protein